jgi:tRNA1Val (adenine37-N6)-methyltransferase
MQSPWSDRIRLIESDVRKYSFADRYDFIITNPPFYESDLRSPVDKKNKARHDESLTLDELMKVILSCLQAEGAFSILLPFHRTGYFEKLAADHGFFSQEKLTIRQTPVHLPFRTILLFRKYKPLKEIINELTIKNEKGKYSPEFSGLMNDYY